ncbi:MAG: trypsin-like peptidase domain-containing protein [Chloroflexi bacterium]|nr:trypsin-like peptidase domain-containing protein [Chloroflexota bacterium]
MFRKRNPIAFSMVVLLLVVLLAGCSVAPFAASQAPQPTPTPTPLPTATLPAPAPEAATLPAMPQTDYEEQLLVRVYEEASPSVVNIRVRTRVSSGFPGFGDFVQQGQGSGFIWDTQGHIVTNYHVVENATAIEVTFNDGISLPATLVGADPDSDLAVIKVDPAEHDLKPVKLGDSDALKVGQRAIAIGNPFGLEGTLTAGVISALGRDLPAASTGASLVGYRIPDVIQTDAPINPGNSGGPLLNSNGEVIGVNAAIESSTGTSAGIGFAIPVSIVKQVVPSLIQTGSYRHPWLGVTVATLSPKVAEAMGLPRKQQGALVVEVTANGPAAAAGLRPSSRVVQIDGDQVTVGGDVIIRIDTTEIKRSEDLISYLVRRTSVGQQVTLTVLRDGKEMEIKVTLGERPTTRERNT